MDDVINQIIKNTTEEYLKTLNQNNPPPPEQIEEELLEAIGNSIRVANVWREKGNKFAIPKTLPIPALVRVYRSAMRLATSI